MTDPVADLLTRIRNGARSRLEKVDVPASRLKANIVRLLRDEGFVKSFALAKEDGVPQITIWLKYDENGVPALRGIRRVSRPGLRRYVGYDEIQQLRRGAFGLAVLSTPRGILSGNRARQEKVGGEYLCEVW